MAGGTDPHISTVSLDTQSQARTHLTAAGVVVPTAAWARVPYDTIDWDLGSHLKTNTTYTSSKNGYYLVSTQVLINIVTANPAVTVAIYKNGARYADLDSGVGGAAGALWGGSGAIIVPLNSGDTVETWINSSNAGNTYSASATGLDTYMSVCRVG